MANREFGVDGWTGVEEWIPERQKEILKFNESFKWDSVAELCSSLRDGIACEVSAKFNVGTNKIVKLVQFEDGIKWVAGIVLPISDIDKTRNAMRPQEQTESEIATHKYLAQHTTLPVPEVFAADSDPNNSLGAPYIIMTFLNGIVVDAFPLNEDGHRGTKEQHEHLLRQMANIVVELAQHKFSRIGSIFQDQDTGNFQIGSDIETGIICRTAQEYYQTVSMHRFKHYSKEHFYDNLSIDREKGFALPLIFNNLITIFSSPMDDAGLFSLVNKDFGFHNILVDETFTIQGIIDCDSIVAAPIDVVAQYPSLSGMNCRHPGYKTTHPLRLRTYGRGEAAAGKFREYVREAEQRLCISQLNKTPISDAMESDGARFVEGIERYCFCQGWVNEDWVKSYWYMYYRKVRGPNAAFEYDEQPFPSDSDSESEGENDNESESNMESDCEENSDVEEGVQEAEGNSKTLGSDEQDKASLEVVHGDGIDNVRTSSSGTNNINEDANDLSQRQRISDLPEDSTTSVESLRIGSDGWRLNNDLPEALLQQIQNCDKSINWQAVASLCSSLRNSMQCTVSQKLTTGTRKLVRLVEFEDGVKWVACVAMEPKADSLTSYPPQYAEFAMKTEMAAFTYLREKTTIPVPEVFAADHRANNDVGRPYMIMSYLHGSSPQEFEYVDGHPGTDLQYKRLLQQMAKITAELAQCKFDRIGALFQDDETKEYYIGIDPEIGAGPFDTPVEYYNAVSKARFNYYTAHIENNLVTEQNKGFELPFIFNNLMPVLSGYKSETGPFSLTNMDFGFHNILVNKDFDIVGVVDCDSIMSAPIESVAQYPSCGKTERIPPGMVTHRSSAKRTWDCYASARRLFHDMLAEAERSYPQNGLSPNPLADALDSNGACLVAGLTEYALQDKKSQQEWLKSYWYMYYRHVKGEAHALTFSEMVQEDASSDDNASNDGDDHTTNDGDGDVDDEGEGDGQEFCTFGMALRSISPPSSPSPRHRSGDDDKAPAIVESGVVEAFKEFATKEKLKVEQSCQERKSRSRTDVLNDLVSFSKNFKLPSPVHGPDSAEDGIPDITTFDIEDLNHEQVQAETADNEDEIGQSARGYLDFKPAGRSESPGDDDSVDIITCDTQNVNRLRLQPETVKNQGEEDNINNLRSDNEDEANCAGIKVTVTDIERFEGLQQDTGLEEAIKNDGIPTKDEAVEDATLKVEGLALDGGQDDSHAEKDTQNINKQNHNEGETGTSNTTAGEAGP